MGGRNGSLSFSLAHERNIREQFSGCRIIDLKNRKVGSANPTDASHKERQPYRIYAAVTSFEII